MAVTSRANLTRNVYGTGEQLQNIKNTLGITGYNYIDTGLPQFTAPTNYRPTDIVIGGTNTNQLNPMGQFKAFNTTTNGVQTANVSNASTPQDFVDLVNRAMQQSMANRPALPTYDQTAETNLINSMYQNQAQAQQTRIQGATEQGVANLQRQVDLARPQYQEARNQTDVNYQQQQRQLNETLADQGLYRAGRNVTQSSILGASRLNTLGGLTRQELQMVDEADFQINSLRQAGLTEQNAVLSELESKRDQMILDSNTRAFERQLELYNTGVRDSQTNLENIMTSIQFAYGVSRDEANSLFEKEKFNYQKAQDTADRLFQDAQFNWQKAQAEIDNKFKEKQFTAEQAQIAKDNAFREKQFAEQKAARLSSAARSSSSGSSSGSSKTSTVSASQIENKAWSEFYKARDTGDMATWLKNNRNNILNNTTANGNKIYQQMEAIANDPVEQKKQSSLKVKNSISSIFSIFK